jgi:ABC-type phosphate transport system substrate-binding protein
VLCIYDRVANVPTAVGVLEVQPNASWTSKDPKGWKYKDTTLAQAGVSGMSLKTGDAGKTKAQLKAGGANFPAPVAASMSQMFTSNPNVTVQLVKEGGAGGALCYASDFAPDDTKKNTATSFKATAK